MSFGSPPITTQRKSLQRTLPPLPSHLLGSLQASWMPSTIIIGQSDGALQQSPLAQQMDALQ